MRVTLIVSLVIAVLAVVFALANPQLMVVNFLFGEASGSTALVLIITFAVGVAVGLLAALPGRVKRRRKDKEGDSADPATTLGSRPSKSGASSSDSSKTRL